MENRAYGSSCPTYGCLGGGRMDDPEYIVTEEIEYKGMKVRARRPVATKDEVNIQLAKTIDDFIRAMTD